MQTGLRIFLFFLFGLGYLLLSSSKIDAHDASLTHTKIAIEQNKINLIYTTPNNNVLTYYPKKGKSIDEIDITFFSKPFVKEFQITNNEKLCSPHLLHTRKLPDIKSIEYTFSFNCPDDLKNLTFRYNLFFNTFRYHENITDISSG